MQLDPKWRFVDSSETGLLYEIEPALLLAVSRAGSHETRATAEIGIPMVLEYMRQHGPGVLIGLVEEGASIDRDARTLYQQSLSPKVLIACCMVGGTALSRAIGSLFFRFTPMQVPYRFFSTIEEALPWARALLAEHPGRAGT